MSFAERYKTAELEFLIRVVESPKEYQPEAVASAKEEIRNRHLEVSDVLQGARRVLTEKIEHYLENFSVINDKLTLPTSYYLNEEEVKMVFRSCFAKWKEENDDMIPDSWLYVLGAGFG